MLLLGSQDKPPPAPWAWCLIAKQQQIRLRDAQVGKWRLRSRQPHHTSALFPSRASQEPMGAEAPENQHKDWCFFFSMWIGKVLPFCPDCEAWEMKDSSQTSKTTIYRIKKIFLLCLSCTLFTWMRASSPDREQYSKLNPWNPLHKYAEGITNPITDLRVRSLFSFTISAENLWQETADEWVQTLPANSASLELF